MGKIVIDVPGLCDPNETAELLDVGPATVWRWIRSGKLIPINVGGRTLIPQSEIDRLNRNELNDI